MFNNGIVNFGLVAIVPLFLVGVFLFMFSSSGLSYAQQNENDTSSSELRFLFIQSAQSGSLSQINDTAYTLELNDVTDKTVSFSDRPYRIVESIDTSEFVGNWSTGEDSFAIDPPNAALVVLDNSDITSEEDIALIELFNPVYDEEANALTYDAIPDNATSIDLPDEFGQATMIIDSGCDPWDSCF